MGYACDGQLRNARSLEAVSQGQATVHFEHAEDGLMIAIKEGFAAPKKSPQAKLSHFELADQSGKWLPADAVIVGKTVVVRHEELSDPVAVQYAYAVDPQHCHLYNRAGLPASPFCSHPELLIYDPNLPREREQPNSILAMSH